MKLKKPIIYLISKGEIKVENFAEKSAGFYKIVRVAIENQISLIQIREKSLPAKFLFQLVQNAVEIAKKSSTKILINDRFDIALAAKADGVHLTSKSITAEIVRKNTPKKFIIGVSAHSFVDVENAKNQGTDFVTLSPIFASPNKGKPIGIEKLKEVFESFKPFPVIGLGGIDETNYEEVLQVADGFAAIRFLNNEENLRKLKNESLFKHRGR